MRFTCEKNMLVQGLNIASRAVASKSSLTVIEGILCRAGNRRLWDIARECGSTVSAIETANGLTGEPENDRMLLIPVV